MKIQFIDNEKIFLEIDPENNNVDINTEDFKILMIREVLSTTLIFKSETTVNDIEKIFSHQSSSEQIELHKVFLKPL